MFFMSPKKVAYLIANFGGPRQLSEVGQFLQSLLTDRDVVRTNFPKPIHHFLFSRVAKKRAVKIRKDYQSIGGKSPIYEDTEAVARKLKESLNEPVITFHRYLTATHRDFINKIENTECEEIRVFPMFPQFTYATTGSIAKWFALNLKMNAVNKMRWIKSYSAHPSFIKAHQSVIKKFLLQNQLKDHETILLFSAHGVPMKFVVEGDLYEDECKASFKHIIEAFPNIKCRLAYQSKFGKDEWLRPILLMSVKRSNPGVKGGAILSLFRLVLPQIILKLSLRLRLNI